MKVLADRLLSRIKLMSALLRLVIGMGLVGGGMGMVLGGAEPLWAAVLALVPGAALLLSCSLTIKAEVDRMKKKKSSGPSPASLPGLIFLGVFFIVGLGLIPLFPPFGIVWCIIIGKAGYDSVKQMQRSNVDFKAEWKHTVDQGRQAKDHYLSRIKEEDSMEENRPRHLPHTPVNYSYDSCAREKRLEQLKSLKEAGIVEEAEYRRRRQDILNGK